MLLGHGDRGVVGRTNERGLHQFAERNHLAGMQTKVRPADIGRVGADRDRRVETEAARLDLVLGDHQQHHLGHRGGRPLDTAIVVVDDPARVGILEQQGVVSHGADAYLRDGGVRPRAWDEACSLRAPAPQRPKFTCRQQIKSPQRSISSAEGALPSRLSASSSPPLTSHFSPRLQSSEPVNRRSRLQRPRAKSATRSEELFAPARSARWSIARFSRAGV